MTAADDIPDIRSQFPILKQKVNGKPLAYLDSAATSQKPAMVLDAMQRYYERTNSNIHRGIHTLAEEATRQYEDARGKIAAFINAAPEEVIFTSGTTMGMNMLAYMLIERFDGGDIVVSEMEHHSNFVIWQKLAKRHGLGLKVIPVTPDYLLDMEKAEELITPDTRIVAISHVSNVLGTINDISGIAAIAHRNGALLVVDGAQAVAHMRIDVRMLDADFYLFSGHKMYGPTGIGVLYGKRDLLRKLEPAFTGGGMIEDVTEERTTFLEPPYRFEAGTPDIAGAIGLGAAVDFITGVGLDAIERHEHELVAYALKRLEPMAKEGRIAIIGPLENRGGAISVVVDGIHAHDLAAAFDKEGIAVRAGFHCAHPLAKAKSLPPTVRASIAIYTTKEDIDRFVEVLSKAKEVFS
jgi:cysteine desulfurase / selenocysteine lyase